MGPGQNYLHLGFQDRGFEAVLLRDTPPTTTLVLRGELDLHAAGTADQAVDLALSEPAETYVLDLAGLRYLNAAGATPLVRLAVTAQRAGARVTARRAVGLTAIVLGMTPIELDDLDRAPVPTGGGCRSAA
ncbi:MAG TPA: STAS domain-containing protein [Acidimicrobiales bacterium]|jgi:anti-anti-sigma regulatory factor